MKQRLILWSLVGVSIAAGWTAYAFATAPDYEVVMNAAERSIWAAAIVTCPIILLGVRFYWVIAINGAMYAIIGLIVEALKRRIREIQVAH